MRAIAGDHTVIDPRADDQRPGQPGGSRQDRRYPDSKPQTLQARDRVVPKEDSVGAAVLATIIGLAIGLLPYVRATLAGFVAVLSMIPPLAVLPILFIVFGLGELSKVVLIIVGILPFLIRDLSQRVLEIPRETIVKAETLGASSLVIALRVALPQLLPRLIQAVRLSLGPAWLFLIAAEAIASEQGLGYRIFLVRRFLAMDVNLTYVIWITLLAFLMDLALRWLSRKLFPWTEAGL